MPTVSTLFSAQYTVHSTQSVQCTLSMPTIFTLFSALCLISTQQPALSRIGSESTLESRQCLRPSNTWNPSYSFSLYTFKCSVLTNFILRLHISNSEHLKRAFEGTCTQVRNVSYNTSIIGVQQRRARQTPSLNKWKVIMHGIKNLYSQLKSDKYGAYWQKWWWPWEEGGVRGT